MKAKRNRTPAGPNRFRIIGGEWRHRRLRFEPVPDLRPTPDGVRETLFNWLAPHIHGARCLDLFAGSGALGFEAASRGARLVVMVDRHRRACQAMSANCEHLGAQQISVVCSDARRYLSGPAQPFDIVYLDPPYRSEELEPVCRALTEDAWLADDAHVFIEHSADRSTLALPGSFELYKQKQAGQVSYSLFRIRADALQSTG